MFMVTAGAMILIASMLTSRGLQHVVPSSLRQKWFVLTVLIGCFIIGYIGYLLIQFTNISFPLETLVSVIFLGGSLFVYGIMSLTSYTLYQLRNLNDNLEHEIEKRTHQLNDINQSLLDSKKELVRQNLFLGSVIDALSHPFYVVDTDTYEIILANKAAGLDLSGAQRTCHWLTHGSIEPCQGHEHPCPIMEVRKSGRAIVVEHVHSHRSGEKRIVEVHGYPIYDESGKLIQVIEYCVDITEKKKIEEDLVKAKQVAEDASKAKSVFLANMSHEIRTPMNAILGMSYFALQTDLDTNQRHCIENVYNSAEHLLGILGDILDFSKIEAGQLKLNNVIFNLHQLVEGVVATMNANAAEKGLKLGANISDDLSSYFIGDDLRLRQILFNLVGNAIKFTHSGSVTITVNIEGEADIDKKRALHFIVSDTGIGIPPEKCTLIFDSFEQADTSITKLYGGSGLGLSICKQLVTLMEGRIWVESQVNAGSSFHFIVTLQPGEGNLPIGNSVATPYPGRENSELQILLVDDNAVNLDVASMMLEHNSNHLVTTAQNGLEALEALAHKDFNVIFMDMQMPVMDGLTAATIIRAFEKGQPFPGKIPQSLGDILTAKLLGRHVPIIAMTANVMGEDQERYLTSGISAYISKPFLYHQLLSVLYATIPSGSEGREEEGHT